MSGYDMPPSAAPSQPKQISSRLLNMKFMQRAHATTNQKNSSAPATPSNEPAAKRRRTGDFSATVGSLNSPSQAPSVSGTPSYGDRTAISGALNAEANGLSIRRGTNNFDAQDEETEWVLNVRLPAINRSANVNSEDEESEGDDDYMWSATAPRGRQTYGSFNKKARKAAATLNTDGGTITPQSTKSSTKKRSRPDVEEDDEDLSSIPSDFDDDSEEGAIREAPHSKKKGKFNFNSEADMKKMDSMNFQKPGFEGLGRQRPGLSSGNAFGAHSPGQAQGRGNGKQKKKRARKTM